MWSAWSINKPVTDSVTGMTNYKKAFQTSKSKIFGAKVNNNEQKRWCETINGLRNLKDNFI